MRSNMCKRMLGVLIFVGMLLGTLTSCEGRGAEPEQSYLVSAMGFDASEEGICVTIEIPVISESQSVQAKTLLFSESGRSVEDALARMQREVPRQLVFSHCALAILGETLNTAQMQEVFAFAEAGENLPLATEVVRADNAGEILRVGSLSAPAVGYEIPELLERERKRMGVEMRCSIYELRADSSPELPVAIPRIKAVKREDGTAVRLEGVDILRPHAEAVRLSAEDWVAYAILSNRFTGGTDMGQRLRKIKRELTAESDGERVTITLNLRMKIVGGTDDGVQQIRREIITRTENLFAYARDTVGEDFFLLGEQIRQGNIEIQTQDLTWIQGATLSVHCEMEDGG